MISEPFVTYFAVFVNVTPDNDYAVLHVYLERLLETLGKNLALCKINNFVSSKNRHMKNINEENAIKTVHHEWT